MPYRLDETTGYIDYDQVLCHIIYTGNSHFVQLRMLLSDKDRHGIITLVNFKKPDVQGVTRKMSFHVLRIILARLVNSKIS